MSLADAALHSIVLGRRYLTRKLGKWHWRAYLNSSDAATGAERAYPRRLTLCPAIKFDGI
jgi:hypothetical protein